MRKCTLVHDECSQSLDSVRCCCAASLRLMRKESRSVERLDYEWSGRRESRVRFANAQPLGASACGRIPKNVPLARFLYGIPPHRFDSRRPSYNLLKQKRPWASIIAVRFSGAGDGNRTRVTSLGSSSSTIEPRPQFSERQYSVSCGFVTGNPP